MFEQAFKNIDDILHKDAGCTSELDYTEQSSWLLFLKYLDALERERAMQAELEGRKYEFLLQKKYRWESWAAPKDKQGRLYHDKALTGPDLIEFVDRELFPYLRRFKTSASGPQTLEYKIGEIFGELGNKVRSGYNLRDVIERVDELRFGTSAEKHELSHLYEAKVRNMGNAGRNGGEYYTPRPLIRAMIRVIDPKIGETIYDGACGSAGFLCEAFDYLKGKGKLSTKDVKTLQEKTFYGKEKKGLAYVIGVMNMILHGIEAPNIVHANTLGENLNDIQPRDQKDIVLANPPFGGKERKEVQQNFPIKTGETAFLFLQHFIRMLKSGGRGAVVIKNTFLSNTDNATTSLRRKLLTDCNLHTVLDCPSGTFQGAGVKTVVLFFEKGSPTRKTWYYQLDPGRRLGKTNPLNDVDMIEFVELQRAFAGSPKSWMVDAASLDQATLDLSVKNPNDAIVADRRGPEAILDEIGALDAQSSQLLAKIRTFQSALDHRVSNAGFDRLVNMASALFVPEYSRRSASGATKTGGRAAALRHIPGELSLSVGMPARRARPGWRWIELSELARLESGHTPSRRHPEYWGGDIPWLSIGDARDHHGGYVADTREKTNELGIANSSARVLPAGTVCLSRTASIGYVTVTTKPMATSQDFVNWVCSPSLNPDFLKFIFLAEGRSGLLRFASGAVHQTIYYPEAKAFHICCPTRSEQDKIVAQCEALVATTAQLAALYKRKFAALDELRQSLLQQAFSGQL